MVKCGRLVLPAPTACATASQIESEDEDDGSDTTESDTDSANEEEDRYRLVRVREERNASSVEGVRKIARYFHKSTVSNDKLKECMKRDLGKELSLVLDCRTRWNSLADMLDRYILLHRPVTKTLININPGLIISGEQLSLIKQLTSCLKPVRMGVESLCQRDTTLIKADGIFSFMMDELIKHETPLSREMRDALQTRFTERRQKNIVSLYRWAFY